MRRLVGGTRYLVIIPIIGLALAAAAFFVFGGISLIWLVLESTLAALGVIAVEANGTESLPIEVEILESVHQFLIGTVLYITAIGFYQLFIKEIKLPGWMQIESTEELETNLVGVTVVVLAINFLAIVFTADSEVILQYGVGIALPIAALALFVALRSWSASLSRKTEREEGEQLKEHAQSAENEQTAK